MFLYINNLMSYFNCLNALSDVSKPLDVFEETKQKFINSFLDTMIPKRS